MDNCIFCKIIKGDIPCFKIYEDNKYLAFLDITQYTDGHTIVIPKEHIETVWDVTYLGEYMNVVGRISRHYREIGYKYVDSLIMGRDVAHAHIHIIPSMDNDINWKNTFKSLEEVSNLRNRRLTKEKGEELVNRLKID